MNTTETQGYAATQFDRLAGFFSRLDAKASALFAMDTALLALMCLNLRPADLCKWFMVPGVLAVLLIAASLYFVYRCSFPHLAGGGNSLIYFREIAKRTEAGFIAEVKKATVDDLTRDLLGQVWRNAEILKIKFDSVKIAFVLAAVALVPWCVFLAAAAMAHGAVAIK